MKATVIVCDRCEARLTESQVIAAEVVRSSSTGRGPKLRRKLDFCEPCADGMMAYATGAPVNGKPDKNLVRELERRLQTVRTRAADAVNEYNGGGECDELLGALRDVATDARRMPEAALHP